MAPTGVPHHRATVPPHRWLAIGSAAAVVVLSVAGSLGLLPGTALGETPARQHIDPSDASGSGGGSSDAGGSTAGAPGDAAGPDVGTGSPDEGVGTSTDESGRADVSLPTASGSGRRVVYDISAQRVWLVRDNGTVQRTYPVSGARDVTKLEPDTYQVTSKSKDAVSYNYKETMHYMVRFAFGERAPIGFHDIPRDPDGNLVQTREELGTPLSAGCIRQWRPDAVAMWRFADVGTTVVVVA